MLHLLHVDASARRRSFSREVGRAFADAWRAAVPGGRYTYRDLAAEPVPPIGEAWTEICDEVLRRGITDIARLGEAVRTPGQRAAWRIIEPLLDELVSADIVLIATPMYNYSVPAVLKAWIDQVTFPKMSLAGRTFVVATARGGSYVPGAPRAAYDYQERYLRDFLRGHFAVADAVFVLAAAAVYLLSRAMNTVPVGTAYVVFTGIGAVGAMGLGIAVHDDPLTPGRLVAAGLIVAGIVVARLTSPG